MSSAFQPLPRQLVCSATDAGRASQGIGPEGDPTGTAEDRGTTTPDGNLTGPEPGSQDKPTSEEPGVIAPDSRPLRDRGLLGGTRQGPAQPQ